MTITEAILKNPFNPNKSNQTAYCRYLRYNVEGWYSLDSKEVFRRWKLAERFLDDGCLWIDEKVEDK